MRAPNPNFFEGRAGFDPTAVRQGDGKACTGAIIDTPGSIDLNLPAKRGFHKGQAGTTGGPCTFKATFADVGVDVDMPFFRQITQFLLDRFFFAEPATMKRDATFFLGNDDFDSVLEDCLWG